MVDAESAPMDNEGRLGPLVNLVTMETKAPLATLVDVVTLVDLETTDRQVPLVSLAALEILAAPVNLDALELAEAEVYLATLVQMDSLETKAHLETLETLATTVDLGTLDHKGHLDFPAHLVPQDSLDYPDKLEVQAPTLSTVLAHHELHSRNKQTERISFLEFRSFSIIANVVLDFYPFFACSHLKNILIFTLTYQYSPTCYQWRRKRNTVY